MVDQETMNRWIDEYVKGIDINERKYLLMNGTELNKFVLDNYYDKDKKRIASGEKEFLPLGMEYLEYRLFDDEAWGGKVNFLICYAPNNIGKYTVLSEMRYYENCTMIARGQIIPITYIEYAEVNKYFRQMGLYKELINEFAKVVDREKPLLSTDETKLGEICHTFTILKDTLIKSGFEQDIRCDKELDTNYYNYLRGTEKILKLTKDI